MLDAQPLRQPRSDWQRAREEREYAAWKLCQFRRRKEGRQSTFSFALWPCAARIDGKKSANFRSRASWSLRFSRLRLSTMDSFFLESAVDAPGSLGPERSFRRGLRDFERWACCTVFQSIIGEYLANIHVKIFKCLLSPGLIL